MPEKLRPRVLNLEGHLGVIGTKQNLRSKVWWPGMDRAEERHCLTCFGCQLMAKLDRPEPIQSTTLPEGPWKDLAADLLGPLPSGESLLVVVDYFSRFYEVRAVRSTTTNHIIDCLEDIFSVHRLPDTLCMGNGSSFHMNSLHIVRWMESNYVIQQLIGHKPTGEVERQNRSLEKGIKIAQEQGQN